MQDIIVLLRMNLVAYTLVLLEIEVYFEDNFCALPFLYFLICIMSSNNKEPPLHLFLYSNLPHAVESGFDCGVHNMF